MQCAARVSEWVGGLSFCVLAVAPRRPQHLKHPGTMSATDGMNVDMDIQADRSIPSQSNPLVGYPPPEVPGQGASGGGKPQRFVEQGI